MAILSGKTIAVAIDGSETSDRALRFALQLSADLGCRVTAVTAVQTEMVNFLARNSLVEQYSRIREFTTWAAERAKEIAAESGLSTIEALTMEGNKDIFEQLADFLAENKDVGCIVMGSRGGGIHSGDSLGSTTAQLIREITRREIQTPVLVVPCGKVSG